MKYRIFFAKDEGFKETPWIAMRRSDGSYLEYTDKEEALNVVLDLGKNKQKPKYKYKMQEVQ